MTQEEKAKRFDEVLAMAKDCITYIHDDALNQYMLDMFPELKESEDEKIRKALISAINNICAGDEGLVTFNGFSKEQVQSWLEKQSEQKPIDKCEGCNNVEGCVACVDGSEWAHIEEQKPFYHENANIQQKNFASIEPKFKVGDWVVTNKNNVVQIKAVNNGYYTIDNGMDFSTSYVDKYWRLWTIEDAKDGDVLEFDCGIGIFKNLSTDGYNAHCYCYYDRNYQIETNDYILYDIYEATPATKGQRDTLLKAMADAGYTFNFEKKELKRIEQNPTWTEEDFIYDTLSNLTELKDIYGEEYGNVGKCIEWFRTLKDKVGCEVNCTTTKEWSEEDEAHFDSILKRLEGMCKPWATYTATRCSISADKDWLKSLKDRVGNFDDGYKV